MKLHRLQRTQRLPVSIEDAWKFFSSPANLRLITPDWLDFQLMVEVPDRMRAGTIIMYRIRPALGIPVRWITEITHVDEPYYFVDEQRYGPYRFWHHQHLFRPVEKGVEMEDIVHYSLPLGTFGSFVHAVIVKQKLQEIFDYRHESLRDRFGEYTLSASLL